MIPFRLLVVLILTIHILLKINRKELLILHGYLFFFFIISEQQKIQQVSKIKYYANVQTRGRKRKPKTQAYTQSTHTKTTGALPQHTYKKKNNPKKKKKKKKKKK